MLAGLVLRMGFACDDNLHGPFPIAENSLEPLHVAEEQRGALIGGETARESDGESVRIEHFRRIAQFRRGGFPARSGSRLPVANEGDQAAFAAAVDFKQFLVRNVRDQLPHVQVAPAAAPIGLEVLDRRDRPGRR